MWSFYVLFVCFFVAVCGTETVDGRRKLNSVLYDEHVVPYGPPNSMYTVIQTWGSDITTKEACKTLAEKIGLTWGGDFTGMPNTERRLFPCRCFLAIKIGNQFQQKPNATPIVQFKVRKQSKTAPGSESYSSSAGPV